MNNLLDVRGLKTYYSTNDHVTKAVDGVDFSLTEGETLGLAGESGCGKSTIGFSIMGYLPPPGRIAGGTISFMGSDLISENRKFRWKEISMIFQGSMNAMNPVLKVQKQIDEVLKTHTKLQRKERKDRIRELLEMVQIDPGRASDYPHQLSGGMRQRIMIAMALSCSPKILIADEPTTNLDVLTQKKITDLLKQLKEQLRLSVIFISHDLPLLSQICDRVVILCSGKVVELERTTEIFRNPKHPYTMGLLESIEGLTKDKPSLKCIPGNVPDPEHRPKGCSFHPRCGKVMEKCRINEPRVIETDSWKVRCWLYNV